MIHFKHSIDVKFDLASLKVCKKTQNDKKSVPERGQNHKIASNSATVNLESKNWQKHEN